MLAWWRNRRRRIADYLGAGVDTEVLRKIEKMDQHQRKLGHDLRNLQTKMEPLRRLFENGDGEHSERRDDHI